MQHNLGQLSVRQLYIVDSDSDYGSGYGLCDLYNTQPQRPNADVSNSLHWYQSSKLIVFRIGTLAVE